MQGGKYTFQSKSANASWVYIDGELVIGNEDQGTVTSGLIDLAQVCGLLPNYWWVD